MARSMALIAVLSICCLSLVGFVNCMEKFYVQGRVYCDNCRAGFETNITEYITGAKVHLECDDPEGDHPKLIFEGITDNTGTYEIPVEGEHEEDICEVVTVSSPRTDCNEKAPGRNRARVHLTKNSGIPSEIRYANSVGFLKKEALPVCAELLKAYTEEESE